MAILDDDFQSYAIGATMPFGPFILDPAAAIAEIVAATGPQAPIARCSSRAR
jgi:hypothetical protein